MHRPNVHDSAITIIPTLAFNKRSLYESPNFSTSLLVCYHIKQLCIYGVAFFHIVVPTNPPHPHQPLSLLPRPSISETEKLPTRIKKIGPAAPPYPVGVAPADGCAWPCMTQNSGRLFSFPTILKQTQPRNKIQPSKIERLQYYSKEFLFIAESTTRKEK